MKKTKTPILMYHSIGDVMPPDFETWVVRPRQFRNHLARLAETGMNTLTVSELVRRRCAREVPHRAAVLTFDDGYADFVHNAMPALQTFGMSATLYVSTGMLGNEFRGLPMLDWGALKAVRDAGFEIGGHTVHHLALDRLSLRQALDEIRGCKHALEDRLGIVVDSFAYPFGFCTPELRNLVIAAGFVSACAVGYDFSPDDDDPLALRRMIVRQRTTYVDRLPRTTMYYRLRSQAGNSVRRIITQIEPSRVFRRF